MGRQMDGWMDELAFPLGISLQDIMYLFRRPGGGILLSLGSGPPQGSLPGNYVASGVRCVWIRILTLPPPSHISLDDSGPRQ